MNLAHLALLVLVAALVGYIVALLLGTTAGLIAFAVIVLIAVLPSMRV